MLEDYIQIQGLNVPLDEARLAQLAAQAVMAGGTLQLTADVLWYEGDGWRLVDYIDTDKAKDAALKQVWMALDSAYARSGGLSAAVVYARADSNLLVRVAGQGRALAARWQLDESTAEVSLAARAAQTGWLSVANDVAAWLAAGSLHGEHRHCAAQMALPVCLAGGQVLGVVYVEAHSSDAFEPLLQAQWVGLTVALVAPLSVLAFSPNQGAVDEE